MTLAPSFLITEKSISAYINGRSYSANTSHAMWEHIKEAVRTKNYEVLPGLFNLRDSVCSWADGRLVLGDNDVLYRDGYEIRHSIVQRVLDMIRGGFDAEPLVLMLDKMLSNPIKSVREELGMFIEYGNLTLAPDGDFYAFKRVRADGYDIYSGTMRNLPGDEPEMRPEDVDPDRDNTCSQGLHFCSFDYLPHFGFGERMNGERIMVVKINPANVVAIPSDYRNTKGRAWKYKVVAEHFIEDGILDKERDDILSNADTPVMEFDATEYTNKVKLTDLFDELGNIIYNEGYSEGRGNRTDVSAVMGNLVRDVSEAYYSFVGRKVDGENVTVPNLADNLSLPVLARLVYAFVNEEDDFCSHINNVIADQRIDMGGTGDESDDCFNDRLKERIRTLADNTVGTVWQRGYADGRGHKKKLTSTCRWNDAQGVFEQK